MEVRSSATGKNEDFSRNLKVLCSAYRSVAELCRRTGINRQQFGRYLNGSNRPSRHNMMRICDALGVTEADLLLPEADFEGFIRNNFPKLSYGAGAGWLGAELERRIPIMDRRLWKYIGWYSCYSYSFGWPDMIARSLTVLHRHRGRVFSKTIDRVKDPVSFRHFIYKTEGVVTMSAGKIYIAEQDSLENEGFALRILEPTPRSHVDLLSGLFTGTSQRLHRRPSAARLVMKYLGPTIDIRKELSRCGIFYPVNKNVGGDILNFIGNEIADGDTVLHSHEV